MHTSRERGVKVYLRAESKQNLPAVLKSIAIENTFISNPVVLIDKKIIWFGMPSSSANFKLSNSVSRINYRPIIRFEGTRTSKVLYGFLEMNKTVDQCESIETDEKGNPTGDTLASYVFATQKCPSCGSPMKMQKSKNGKFFLSCTNSTSCKQTSTIDVALVKRYLYRHNRTAQQCIRCKFSLEAKVGKYGLYVQCGGFQHHRFKLDEI